MDGFALRTNELSRHPHFNITDLIPAGSAARKLGTVSGTCVEIMTGAVVPDDCDCVIPYEASQQIDAQTVKFPHPAKHKAGASIHRVGSDHLQGDTLLTPGTRLGAREIAIAATCGHAELTVTRLPAITIISTGDELVPVHQQPAAHQIRRSNDLAIETALACHDLPAKQRLHLPDDPAIATLELEQAVAESDILIIAGGISKGKKDYIPEVLDQLGLQKHFHGVAQKPGKPMGFWSSDTTAAFALPGNPLSVLVSLHRYVIPALKLACGQNKRKDRFVDLPSDTKTRDDLTIFLPAQLDPHGALRIMPAQNSGDFVSILQTNGFIELLPSGQRHLPRGTSVRYIPWA